MIIDKTHLESARRGALVEYNMDEDPKQREQALQEALDAAQEEKERLDYLLLSAAYRAQQDRTASPSVVIGAAEAIGAAASKPSDNAPALTRRLVSAKGALEVRQVISDAHRRMVNLRLIAAMGGEDAAEARRYIRKLEKVVSRGQKKVRDLSKEDGLKADKKKAKAQKQKRREEQIKTELRRRGALRNAREQGYVLETTNEKIMGLLAPKRRGKGWGTVPGDKLDPATEARIAQRAERQAEAEQVAEGDGAAGSDANNAGGEAGGMTMGGSPPAGRDMAVAEPTE